MSTPIWSRYAAHRDTPITPTIDALLRDVAPRGISASDAAELRSISAEANPELAGADLLAFGARQEQAGNILGALASYQAVAELNAGHLSERARERIAGVSGVGESGGLRPEFLLRRVAHETCNPGMLLGMGLAGAGFRALRFGVAARLAASPSAGFFSQGLGANLIAGAAGMAVEAPIFSLTSRAWNGLTGASGSHGSLGEEVLNGYLLLGSLRLAGSAAVGLHRATGLGEGLSLNVARQGGMFAGIYGSRVLERHLNGGAAAGSSDTWDSLALLLQFNAAGRLSGHLLGENFAAWERNIDARTSALSIRLPRLELGLPGLQPELALASAEPARMEMKKPDDLTGPQVSLMKAESDGELSKKYDQSGIELLRGLRKLHVPEHMRPEDAIRRFIESSQHPIAVAVQTSKVRMPDVAMVNDAFARNFGYLESSIKGTSVEALFEDGKKSFTIARITSNLVGLVLGRPVEFDPTPMQFKMADGTFAQLIGAGLYLKIHGTSYAFGIFTQVEGGLLSRARTNGGNGIGLTIPPPPGSPPPPPVRPARLSGQAKPVAPGVDHFRAARKHLNGGGSEGSGED